MSNENNRGEIIPGSAAEGEICLEKEDGKPFGLSPYSSGLLIFCNCKGVRTEITLAIPGPSPDAGGIPYALTSTQTADADEKWKSADVELKDIDTPAVAQIDNVLVGGVTDGLYEVILNSITFGFTAASNTAAQIVAGLVAAINLGSEPVTASPSGDNLVLTADVAGTPFVSALGGNPATNMVLTTPTPNVVEVSSIKVIPLLNQFEIIERACPPTA